MKQYHVNTFKKGINQDLTLNEVPADTLMDAVNVELNGVGEDGAMVNMQGTSATSFVMDALPGFNVIATFPVRAKSDQHDLGNSSLVRGILAFVTNGTNDVIYFFDTDNISSGVSVKVIEDISLPLENAFVDGFHYEDRGVPYFYWVDGQNVYRRIKLVFEGAYTAPTLKEIHARPLNPIDQIEYSSIDTNGRLLAGGYHFFFRYYNTETCVFSAWSLPTTVIPVLPDSDNPDRLGGLVGQSTNKTIVLSVPTALGAASYDSIQLAVVKKIDGSRENSGVAFLTQAKKEWYDNPTDIRYTGQETEIDAPISQIVIEDAPIVSAGTIQEKEDRVFLGDVTLRDFTYDKGSPTEITHAETIVESKFDMYKSEDDYDSVGYWRNELYPFGIVYFDEYGNAAPVEPFDLTNYGPAAPDPTWFVGVTAINPVSDPLANTVVYDVAPPVAAALQIGDTVTIGGFAGQLVVDIIGNTITVKELPGAPPPPTGTIVRVNGAQGNAGSSWAWKFGDRSQPKLSLLDENNDTRYLGLRLKGIKNHPSWAKGFAIVRRLRTKDILYQSVHVPCGFVQGVPTPGVLELLAPETTSDYDGALDYFYPKQHSLGNLKNIVPFLVAASGFGGVTFPKYAVKYDLANEFALDGDNTNPVVALYPPEYLFNDGGDPYEEIVSVGATLEIVDAALIRISRQKDNFYTEPISGTPFGANRRLFEMESPDRTHYYHRYNGHSLTRNVDGFKTYDFPLDTVRTLWGPPVVEASPKIDEYFALAQGHGTISFFGEPMFNTDFENVKLFGSGGELAEQQLEHSSVTLNSEIDWFYTQAIGTRRIIVSTDDVINDFGYHVGQANGVGGQNSWVDYPPFVGNAGLNNSWNYPPPMLDTVPPLPGTSPVLPETDLEVGDATTANYILNAVLGLGDDRYGAIEDNAGAWIFTGAYQPLTQNDIDTSTTFNVDVFGGDCFVTKGRIKIDNQFPLPGPYTVGIETKNDAYFDTLSYKAGYFRDYAEFLDVYLESEVNMWYGVDWPARSYEEAFDYKYNRGYSAQIKEKVFLGKDHICNDGNIYRSGMFWSDPRVRGALSTPFFDFDGFTRFGVNNLKVLDERYGEIERIVDLNDKAVHVFQRNKIFYQPIGVDELRTTDSRVIEAGSGELLGNGGFYLPVEGGCQNPRTIVVWAGDAYWVDVDNSVISVMGSRGNGFARISNVGLSDRLGAALSERPDYANDKIFAFWDNDRGRYCFVNRDTKSGIPFFGMWNKGQSYWETFCDTGSSPMYEGVSLGDDVFWFSEDGDDPIVHRAYTGEYNVFFGNVVPSTFRLPINAVKDVTKTFDVVQVNSLNRIDSFVVRVFNEDAASPNQETGVLSLDVNPRNMQYYNNKLRYVSGGRKYRLRGMSAEMDFTIDNVVGAGNKKVIVSSIMTTYRKSFGSNT